MYNIILFAKQYKFCSSSLTAKLAVRHELQNYRSRGIKNINKQIEADAPAGNHQLAADDLI
jgi:sulfur transfer protein SufE